MEDKNNIKMIKKNYFLIVTSLSLVFAIFLIGFAGAFGVSSPVWKDNPLIIFPGETKIIDLALQNMVGNENVTVRPTITKGLEIASTPNKDYLVELGTKDTEVPITISIPLGVPVDSSYVVTVAFKTVVLGEGGGVSIGTDIDTTFDVLVVQAPPPEPSERLLILLLIIVIVVILILIFIFWIFRRRKVKKKRRKRGE